MTTREFRNRYPNICEGSRVFIPEYETMEEAWNACPRADWMLWYAFTMQAPIFGNIKSRALLGASIISCFKDIMHVKVIPILDEIIAHSLDDSKENYDAIIEKLLPLYTAIIEKEAISARLLLRLLRCTYLPESANCATVILHFPLDLINHHFKENIIGTPAYLRVTNLAMADVCRELIKIPQ